jgi:hypothetical protein
MGIHARTHVSAFERCTVSKQEPKRSGCADPTRYTKFSYDNKHATPFARRRWIINIRIKLLLPPCVQDKD